MATTPFTDAIVNALKANKQGGKLFAEAGETIYPKWFCCISGNTVGVDKDPVAVLLVDPRYTPTEVPIRADYSLSWSPTSTISTWSINWGDGNTSNGAWPGSGQVSHPAGGYALPGEYTVTLTVTDLLGATDKTSLTVEAYEPVCIFETPERPFKALVSTYVDGAGEGALWYADNYGYGSNFLWRELEESEGDWTTLKIIPTTKHTTNPMFWAIKGGTPYLIQLYDLPGPWNIIDADSGFEDRLYVAGDKTSQVSAGDTIRVQGSTANDGDYVLTGVLYSSGSDRTELSMTVGSLTDTTADGTVIVLDPRRITAKSIPGLTATAIVPDKNNPAKVYALAYTGTDPYLCMSEDYGDTWSTVAVGGSYTPLTDWAYRFYQIDVDVDSVYVYAVVENASHVVSAIRAPTDLSNVEVIFTAEEAPDLSPYMAGVYCTLDRGLWLFGRFAGADNFGKQLYFSIDYGDSFENVSFWYWGTTPGSLDDPAWIASMTSFKDGVVMVCMGDDHVVESSEYAMCYITADHGRSWWLSNHEPSDSRPSSWLTCMDAMPCYGSDVVVAGAAENYSPEFLYNGGFNTESGYFDFDWELENNSDGEGLDVQGVTGVAFYRYYDNRYYKYL